MARFGVIIVALVLVVLPAVAVAAGPPTITADPAVLGVGAQLVLQGTAPGSDGGELVEIEAKDCGSAFFRVFAAARTNAGGVWRYQGFAEVNTTFRARYKDSVSSTVDVKHRIFVSLLRRSPKLVVATVVTSHQRMIGKTVRLERHTTRGWVLVSRAKIRRLAGPASEARFLFSRNGVQLRAVVDQANARPCHVAGVSTIIRS